MQRLMYDHQVKRQPSEHLCYALSIAESQYPDWHPKFVCFVLFQILSQKLKSARLETI